jgi:hypothetical protein
MPYIKANQRIEIDPLTDKLSDKLLENLDPGEYNYVISRLIHKYILQVGERYKNFNTAIGILECVKSEFLRTVVAPYEDKKSSENGAVSELDATIKIIESKERGESL